MLRGDEQEKERILSLAARLREAERPIRVLRTIAWPPEVRERFFAAGERELPRPTYQPPACGPTLEAVAAMRPELGGEGAIDRWLERVARAIEGGARMLAATGTEDFYHHARELYGTPTTVLIDGVHTPLDLARQLDEVLSGFDRVDLGAPAPACHSADVVAERMRAVLPQVFGDDGLKVEVVDHLSANAVAGRGGVRIRRGACFSDRDLVQLTEHEAFVHAVTSLNGAAQHHLPLLGAGHPGTTKTQEGLAVFAEMISGAMDPHRLRRLADRVLAIQMAIDGADFLQVYRYFKERTGEREQAFENARRVFRGAPLTGGFAFTKDVVYLDGLLRVHNFLRAAVAARRIDCLRLLFCGKLDLEDVPALGQLAAMGLLEPPRYLPPWADDRRFLVSYLAYSSFLNRIDLARVREHVEKLLAETPVPAPATAQG
ncbi:MAG: DUF1704 domain-containing protein [Acidobacteria bacterium]|nr:MAG: DUF1704 domain-containing protein [Acidobacteriota bacterium]